METDCVAQLNKCHIHVTLKGSEFDQECEFKYAIKFTYQQVLNVQ